ncbi:MAG: uncharacterized protein KVP18_001990 [Porospora cf. gigantea A]|uniref:uncharacterized protein n=2 Tax=Porospora cf. gigantea A TaxID=2853593 RepID=UPI00355A0B9B|nr:MAG: hypothetical protein KVP18_001990 [Porospora cf. gigantea A]
MSLPVTNEAEFRQYQHLLQGQGRPPVAPETQLCVFLTDLECAMASAPAVVKARQVGLDSVPRVTLFGVTDAGMCVALHVWGFQPYFYVAVDEANEDPEALGRCLDDLLKANGMYAHVSRRILSVEVVQKQSLRGFSVTGGLKPYYKVKVADPRMISGCRTAIEKGQVRGPFGNIGFVTFESGVPATLRFLIDKDMDGCSWFRIHEKHWMLRSSDPTRNNPKLSRCSFEADILMEHLEAVPPEGEWQRIPAGLRIMSFDIECVAMKAKGFPQPENDPVITIASVVKEMGRSEPIAQVILSLRETSNVPGSILAWFTDERLLLEAWAELVRFTDPDIITGWNCFNFDLNYLMVRASRLKTSKFTYLGRFIDVQSRITKSVLSTRAYGTHENKDISMMGRVSLDMLDVTRREHKLKSYTLNFVSGHFLNEQKEDVHYSMIGDLFDSCRPDDRRRLASYCLKDAVLPIRLMDKLLVVYNMVEMARVTGTPMSFLLTRGQQIKVTSQILRRGKEEHYIMPSERSGGDTAKYEGATVLEPEKGYYQRPITTLDFASLYPSIMMAHNLCYTTLLRAEDRGNLREEDYTQTPVGAYFVKSHVKQGLLPRIVTDLISARSRAKKQMAVSKDPMTCMVLNGRQLALKISANSVYGYTGATAGGQMPCLEISTSITGFGRQMIDFTREQVESKFTVAHGYPSDAHVIYGDTDSVMIDFRIDDLKKCMELGVEAADFVSQQFVKPIKLEFEKCFFPYLLMNKKRYAGLLWTNPHKYDKMDCKGIETVRRDFCRMVQTTVDEALKLLLIEGSKEKAVAKVKQVVSDLLQSKIDMADLVLCKSIGKDEYAGKLAHIELQKKLKLRDPSSAPNVGDRIDYVITAGAKNQPQYDRAEDPLFVLENNLAIDTAYYLDSMKNPVMRIFEAVLPDPESLFSGEHTRDIKVNTSTKWASRFGSVKKLCLGCRVAMPSGVEVMCAQCRKSDRETEVVLDKIRTHCDKENTFHALWTECQRCQGSVFNDIICTSRDCPIFYRRVKARREFAEGGAQMQSIEDAGW